MSYHSFGLEDHEVGDGGEIGVEFEELTLPDEALAQFVDGLAVGVGLLEEGFVEVVADLSLGEQFLCGREGATGGVDVHGGLFPTATTDTDFATWVGHEIGLGNFTFGAIGQFADDLYDVFAFGLDQLWQFEYFGDFLDDAVEFAFEIDVVVDDAQVGMPCPCTDDFLVEFACYA